MSFTNLLKQLKKKLRQKRRLLTLGALLLAAGVSASASALAWSAAAETGNKAVTVFGATSPAAEKARKMEEANQKAIATLKQDAQPRKVYHQKNYVCGEEVAEIGMMDAEAVIRYQQDHPEAVITLKDNNELSFVEEIEDMSNQCKETAYFGIDKNSNLSLFDGLPAKEQVIRTFFQLNVDHLRSSLPSETINQLYSGIRVSDMEEFNSVISTFSDYAMVNGRD